MERRTTRGVEPQWAAGPTAGPLPGAAEAAFLREYASGALRSHPRFQEAVRVTIGSLVERYSRDGPLNRVMNDRGRWLGGLIALYLHFAPPAVPGGTEAAAGLTVGRFQALCAELKLCSPGRARALLALMRYAGYLAPAPPSGAPDDRRLRRLVPTERLIELHRQRWRRHFEAMALIMPEGRRALEAHNRPGFMPAFVRHLGKAHLAGFRPVHHAPGLAGLVESNAGMLVVASLFLAATDGPAAPGGGTAVPISISELSRRFGVGRTQARRLLAGAAEAGLVRRAGGSETVIVLPRLVSEVGGLFAALFALLAHCSEAAAAEVGGAPSAPTAT